MCVSEKERKKAGAEREVKAAAERESGAGRWVNHGWPRMAPDGPGWTRMNTETNAAKPEGRKKVGGLGARKTCLNRGMTIVISLPCL